MVEICLRNMWQCDIAYFLFLFLFSSQESHFLVTIKKVGLPLGPGDVRMVRSAPQSPTYVGTNRQKQIPSSSREPMPSGPPIYGVFIGCIHTSMNVGLVNSGKYHCPKKPDVYNTDQFFDLPFFKSANIDHI